MRQSKTKKKEISKTVAQGIFPCSFPFAERHIVPSLAIDSSFFRQGIYLLERENVVHEERFLTNDGVLVEMEFCALWDVHSDGVIPELNYHCEEIYGMRFADVRNIWANRLGIWPWFWYELKMRRV